MLTCSHLHVTNMVKYSTAYCNKHHHDGFNNCKVYLLAFPRKSQLNEGRWRGKKLVWLKTEAQIKQLAAWTNEIKKVLSNKISCFNFNYRNSNARLCTRHSHPRAISIAEIRKNLLKSGACPFLPLQTKTTKKLVPYRGLRKTMTAI